MTGLIGRDMKTAFVESLVWLFTTKIYQSFLSIPRSSENLEMKAFEKFENAVFFKIFKIPSDRQLILV